jgi:3-hydroxybutyryl-CoA dehydratase
MTGPEIMRREFTVTREQVIRYADVADDHNPLHLDDGFAREHGFAGAIAHGLLTMGLVSSALDDWFGDRWSRGGRLDVRFTAPVPVDSTITVVAEPSGAHGHLPGLFDVTATVGATVVIRGTAEVART